MKFDFQDRKVHISKNISIGKPRAMKTRIVRRLETKQEEEEEAMDSQSKTRWNERNKGKSRKQRASSEKDLVLG